MPAKTIFVKRKTSDELLTHIENNRHVLVSSLEMSEVRIIITIRQGFHFQPQETI
jgi:hypothetical protein